MEEIISIAAMRMLRDELKGMLSWAEMIATRATEAGEQSCLKSMSSYVWLLSCPHLV